MTPADFREAALGRTRNVLVDLDEPFTALLMALVVGGNVLIEGVPGTAKTLLARCIAALLQSPSNADREQPFARIQSPRAETGAPTSQRIQSPPAETGDPTSQRIPSPRAETGAPTSQRIPSSALEADIGQTSRPLQIRPAEAGEQTFQRIQFTPDLMPSDILGTNVFHMQTASFTFRPGPIFANVVVADEINRAPAKTQSALLEAMEEHQVTVEGQRLPLPPVFLVVATQNPVEFEGTYPLPEAQLDRFLFKLLLDYGTAEAERGVVQRHHAGLQVTDLTQAGLSPIADVSTILDLRQQVATIKVDDSVADYLVAIGRATRGMPEVQYGASVRGALGLLHASKAVAAFAGRDYVTPDDVKAIAASVLRHRVILKPEAELDGLRPDDVIQRILGTIAVPR